MSQDVKRLDLYQRCLKQFEKLKDLYVLPSQIELKLNYLIHSLQKKEEFIMPKDKSETPIDLKQIQFLDDQSKRDLFCHIVNCCIGKEVIQLFKNQQFYLKKDQLFSSWSERCLTCNSKILLISKKSNQQVVAQLNLQELKISKAFQEHKKKYAFGLVYKNQKFLLGFNSKQICQNIHLKLKQIVKQTKHSKKTTSQIFLKKQGNNACSSSSTSPKKQFNQGVFDEEQIVSKFEEDNFQQDEFYEMDSQITYINELLIQDSYQLYKNFDKGRILCHNTDNNKAVITILLDVGNPEQLIQAYSRMDLWNQQILEYTPLNVSTSNSFTIFMKLKRYNFWSNIRGAYIKVRGKKHGSKYYILMNSSQNDIQNGQNNFVNMNFKQYIQCFRNDENPKYVLLNIYIQIDFLGYSSQDDNKNMLLKFVSQVEFFFNYFVKNRSQTDIYAFDWKEKKEIVRYSKEPAPNRLFSLDQSKIQENLKDDPIKTDDKSQLQNLITSIVSHKLNKREMLEQFKQLLDQAFHPDSERIPERLIKILQQQNLQQHLYLGQKFDLENHYDPSKFQHFIQPPKDFIFQNGSWKLNAKNQFTFVNQQLLNEHKGVLKIMLKKIMAHVMSGKSIMTMALPVQIFSDKTLLQQFAYSMGYLGKFLVPASKSTSQIEQISNILCFFLGQLNLFLNIGKPFNPLFGQTYQCRIAGILVNFQQIQHHPPISAFYIKTDQFQFYGNFLSHFQLGLNAGYGYPLTNMYFNIFSTNSRYVIHTCSFTLGGLMMGQRTWSYFDFFAIMQEKKQLYLQVGIDKEKKGIYELPKKHKTNQLAGGIYKVKPQLFKRYPVIKGTKRINFDGITKNDIIEQLATISGNFADEVFLDGKKIKSLYEPVPNRIEPVQWLLPSDSRFRPDLLSKKNGMNQQSQDFKEYLEEKQRADRKLRQKYKKQK